MARYGYKPKAVPIRGMSLPDVLRARLDPAIRLFRSGMGYHVGEVMAGSNVAWAGATTGATSFEEAIAMLKAVNPTVGARAEAFGRESKTFSGVKGGVWVQDNKGRTGRISKAAFNRAVAGRNKKGIRMVAAPSMMYA